MDDRQSRGATFFANSARHGISVRRRGDSEFRQSVRIFNGAIESEAVALALPRNEDELALAIRIASDLELALSLKGGGHGVLGRAVSGDVILDFHHFRSIARTSDSTVLVGSGTTWAELDRYTSLFGKVIPGGIVSSTGVAGLTLGGGIGWLLPLYGLSCDSLVSLAGVSADGRVVQLDDEITPDIMRVARGYGHGLLAVTSLEFELHDLPGSINGGTVTFDISDAGVVLEDLMSASDVCPVEINYSPALMRLGSQPFLAIDGVSFGTQDFAHWICSRTDARPTEVSTSRMTYPHLQRMLDNPHRWGQRCSWRSWFGDRLNRAQISALITAITESPSPSSAILIERLVGAAKDERRPASFPLRQFSTDVLILANWVSPDEDDANKAWAEAVKRSVTASSDTDSETTYVNYGDKSEHTLPSTISDAVRAARATLDPHGLFRLSYK